MIAPAESASSVPRRRGRRQVTTPYLAAVLMALLSLQFLLGTYLNLYVSIPSAGVGALPLDGLTVLILHILLGIMVVGTSLRLTGVAVKAHNGRQTALAALAAVGMILAFLSGADFAFNGPSDASSFVMAFGFFLGMIGSAFIVAAAHLPRPEGSPPGGTASR